jgi:hypothetical protein
MAPATDKKLYEARKRAEEPKKKDSTGKRNNCTTLSYSSSIPDCGPTRPGGFRSGMSRWLTLLHWRAPLLGAVVRQKSLPVGSAEL